MRILSVATRNIGGLPDMDLEIPDQPIVAFAGPNGTGKSKLLACILVPWTGSFPVAADKGQEASIVIRMLFSDSEIDAFEAFDKQAGWNQGRPPSVVEYRVLQHPYTGIANVGVDGHAVVQQSLNNPSVLQRNPSLNLVFLPAERRLLPSGVTTLDLSQLADEVGLQHLASARASGVVNGRLDDQEFESYAKALFVASSLPDESSFEGRVNLEKAEWLRFKSAVDRLLYPKWLRPLTRQNPTDLLIGLPGGGSHPVHDLSSGERQALIIMSRVFRAGEGHSLTAIDEPDAYLHPTLSSRLIDALSASIAVNGRLIIATHSPAILDGIPPEAIFRLIHGAPPKVVESETDRLTMYRDAGFRASALTQASMLLVTEGSLDSQLLPKMLGRLGGAAVRAAGGRDLVLRTVDSLSSYDLPIFGVVDADVAGDPPRADIAGLVHVWSCADIEGVLLSDDNFLQAAIEGSLVSPHYDNLQELKGLLGELLRERKDEAIAELAQRHLRTITNISWPSPRGDKAHMRLLALAGALPQLSVGEIQDALNAAELGWANALPSPWSLVRGKWIIKDFVKKATGFANADAFLMAVLSRRPRLAEVDRLDQKLTSVVGV